MEIRPLQPTDVDAAAALLAALATEFITGEFEPHAAAHFLATNDAEAIRRFIASGYRYHVAEEGGRLFGFVGVRDNCHLYHLFVAKSAQRKGLGRSLWETAKAQCEADGHRGAFTVNSSNNAVSVYESMGFRRAGPPVNSNGVIYNPMKLEAANG